MNNLPTEYIDNYADDSMPALSRHATIHVYRRKAYNRKRFTYRIGTISYGYSDNLSFDHMILELRDIVSWYKDNAWISSNGDYRINWNIRVVKHYNGE